MLRILVGGDKCHLVQRRDDDRSVIAAGQFRIDPGRDVLMANDMGARTAAEHAAPVQEGELYLVAAEMPLLNALLEMDRFAVFREGVRLAAACVFHVYHRA